MSSVAFGVIKILVVITDGKIPYKIYYVLCRFWCYSNTSSSKKFINVYWFKVSKKIIDRQRSGKIYR